MTYPDELWQLTAGPGAPLRQREAELVPIAAERIRNEMLSHAAIGRDLDPMHLAQLAVHAVFDVVEPYEYEERDPACPTGTEGCKGGLFCRHRFETPGARAALAKIEENWADEKATRAENPGNAVEMHGLLWQEDGSMHVGGSRTWYSAYHGRRDH